MAGKQGLGSDNMSEKKKHEIQSAGGSASGANFKRSAQGLQAQDAKVEQTAAAQIVN
jgi:general stress protein YciG